MSANYLQLAQIASTQEFQQRVSYAMGAAAGMIYNEGAGVANHSARAAFAIRVANGNYILSSAALAIITASAITASAVPGVSGNAILDTDIANSVSSLWNMFAGV
jgi:hypothetical protein